MRRVLALIALATALVPAATLPAQAAPHEFHTCPNEARGTVTHSGDSSWIATGQSSRLTGFRIERVGGDIALVCEYLMFGGTYWIYKRPSADFPNCQPRDVSFEQKGFYCIR